VLVLSNRPDMTARSPAVTGEDTQSAMSQPLIVSVPHRLGRQEARRRLDRGIGRLQGELGAILSGLDHHWQGDTLNFTASAMWQRITGRIEVLDDAVRVEIELPWVMQLLRDTIAKRVRGRGVALLDRPPGEA
jgi:putative polyhydroxyalkanoate system protein